MTDKTSDRQLWTPRSVEDTVALYRDWAATYDTEIAANGYVTPTRLANAMATVVDPAKRILDYGCGTGLSGQALLDAGFTNVDGTDITEEMLSIADERGVYGRTWLSSPDAFSVTQNQYDAICAVGVISLGAAPPEMLATLLSVLPSGGHLGFSFNDPTLADQNYLSALSAVIDDGRVSLVFREHGPHLIEKNMGSDVIILRKS